MKIFRLLCACVAVCLFSAGFASASPWVTVYYGGWWTHEKNENALRPEQIDYSAFTHIIYFAVVARPDGTLDLDQNGVDQPQGREVTTRAHRAGKKVLISWGGTLSALSNAQLGSFINEFVDVVKKYDYDGVDLDWEPLKTEDAARYTYLIHALRSKLGALAKQTGKSHYLITAAVAEGPALFAKLQNDIDQINLMTYDLSGLWSKKTWHNSALQRPADETDLSSVADSVTDFENAGVKPSKLAIGIDFYGYQWESWKEVINKPGQPWLHDPDIDDGVSYTDVVTKYLPESREGWDSLAQVPYLSHEPGDSKDHSYFLSYENPRSCKAKMDFVVREKLGGLMAWELGGQWLGNLVSGDTVKDPLLQSLKTR